MQPMPQSLFDQPAAPILGAASDWVTGTLMGSVANNLCVIAVAFVGLLLLTGRLAIREGVKVAVGCFVLLGAPVIAAELRIATNGINPETGFRTEDTALPPPSTYDPYAGASLLQD